MSALKFSKLSLCSASERSALQISFNEQSKVLIGGNGFGKSAIVKSLYDTLGAKPHKIDDAWRSARVVALLEFSVDGERYAALKFDKTYVVFDSAREILINTEHVGKELADFLARKLDFKLRMANRQEKIVTPPPSYIFAPFYVDQDASWQAAWKSFDDFYLPDTPANLAEYHSGLKPNDYYNAKAQRDLLLSEQRPLLAERDVIDATLRRIRESIDAIPLNFDLAAFQAETNRLVGESQKLHDEQSKYRKKLGELSEERTLWREQEGVVHAALAEMNQELHDAMHLHGSVECPMCGQHYRNGITNQFELVEDEDTLIGALGFARSNISSLDAEIEAQRATLGELEGAFARVQATLAAHKTDISLQDVLRAEGKSEASRILTAQLAEADEKCGRVARELEEAKRRMDQFTSANRTKEINGFFAGKLREYERMLDVRSGQARAITVKRPKIARGSEGPRGLLAFYFAFLRTAKEHGSSAFCPIVVDAPNQQGQDEGHLDTMMRFMLDNLPEGAQLIVAAESMTISADVEVEDISSTKNSVLRQEEFDEVTEYIRPYLQKLV